jgi:shikimate dehydrogenase
MKRNCTRAHPTLRLAAPYRGRLCVATSVGLFPHVEGRLDLDAPSLRPSMVVADVIPNAPRTPLIRDAEGRGCIVLDGLGMLVNQGAISIRHWIGIDADPTVMRRKLEDLFGV